MVQEDRCTALGTMISGALEQLTDDILLLPTLSPPDSSALASLLAQVLSLDTLFPRNRVAEYVTNWSKYKFLQQLLECDLHTLLVLWRTGRLRTSGWDATDIIEFLNKRFGRSAEVVIREIRRTQIP